MEEHHCDICEAEFYTDGDAWGDGTCGDCIAAAIELGLIGLGARKPPRRAAPAAEPTPAVAEERRTA